jgi:signal transduction histidine kinase
VSNVTAIVDDDHGTLWIGSGAGILQLRRSEWARLLTSRGYVPKFRLYDRSDGLAGLPFVYGRNRRAIRADDGRLWFVTGRGLTIIDPSELDTDAVASPVHIEGILANGQRTIITPGALRLPAGTNRLELEYSALNLTSPLRQHFRYKLDGFDVNWIDAGARRQAFYTNLPPRSYTFRVITSDAEGSWTHAQEAALRFSIRPMFYQTTWFLALSVAALVGVVGVSWRVHVSSVRRQFALLLGERARLSRELHDTLLQNLVGIALQIDAVANDPKLTASDEQRREFVRVRRRVEQYIREARQSISDLRSARPETHDLAMALREAGEREINGRPIQFTFAQNGTARPFPATLEEQLLKIGREAIVNAARHAQADRISVEIESGDRAVTLRVSDNGTGFDPASIANNGSAHYGLTSMRERAEEMGGQLTVNSAHGRGTRVEATVPLHDSSRGKSHGEFTGH